MGRRSRGLSVPKKKRRKKVLFRLLEREHGGQVTAPYRMMDDLIKWHHPHLTRAKIGIAFRKGWNPDSDGFMKLGQAKKASDLDRSLHEFDFLILLNEDVFGSMKEAHKVALIDHELCHCTPVIDSNGEQKIDEKGRPCWRIRKHDLEEFRAVVARHGAWKDEIAALVKAAADKNREPLFAGEPPEPPAIMSNDDDKPASSATSPAVANLISKPQPAPWESVAIDALREYGLSRGLIEKLTEADINTLGQLEAARAEGNFPGRGLRKIDGIGDGAFQKIEDASLEWLSENRDKHVLTDKPDQPKPEKKTGKANGKPATATA